MLGTLLLLCASCLGSADAAFDAAMPVWPAGRETERNLSVRFRAVVELDEAADAALRLTGSTVYRAFVNGAHAGYGPARAGHGYYRVDEWDITLQPGRNVVAVEVAGYNVNSYYLLDQPSFLQAEVVADGRVLAATGGEVAPFEASVFAERVQKVQRYSFQRPFVEVYTLGAGWDTWRSDPDAAFPVEAVAVQETKRLLSRGVPYPDFHLVEPAALAASGAMAEARDRARPWRDRSLVNIGPELGGYPMDELQVVVSDLVGALRTGRLDAANRPLENGEELALEAGEFHIVDLGRNATGFPRFTVTCAEPVRLFVTFDEVLANGDVDWKRLGCVSVLTYDLEPGTHGLEAFEPYTLRGLKFIAARGACTIRDVALRTYENPETGAARFACSDPRLMEIFTAAKHTFAQNALDVFMDCPHRERAGWLCDSYFTAEAARHISGNTSVERAFLENFALPERFAHLPEGMLPMCYPADHNDGVFIPNWALWCVVQLGTYLDRGGDRALVDAMRPKVLALFEYFKPFENGDGLLEKLESWVFVEWSKANEFVQDVNYPSNMLYAGALSTAARLYELPELEERAEAVRRVVREQSFNGRFFVDNALRKEDGTLEVTENHSEVCQYFAFFFGVATPETHGELQRRLVEEFGPGRAEKGLYPEVHPANMFIGHMLRLELLSRWHENVKVMESLDGYFHHMAEKTGTLWENDGAYASLNHGFASHAAVSLYRDVLGVVELDPVARRIRVHVPDVPLAWCEGTIPVGQSAVYVRWERLEGGGIRLTSRVPGDFGAEYTSALNLAERIERHAPQAF